MAGERSTYQKDTKGEVRLPPAPLWCFCTLPAALNPLGVQ